MNKIFNKIGICLISLAVFMAKTASATTYTVDKEPGSDYTSIRNALNQIGNSKTDTVLIRGSNIDTYSESFDGWYAQTVTIRSDKTNPDSFPILTITDWDVFWGGNETVRFENLILDNCDSIKLNSNFVKLKNVIVRNFSGSVFFITNETDNILEAENVIFHENSGTVVNINFTWGTGPYGTMNNCTFYGNGAIQRKATLDDNDSPNNRLVLIKNSIFDVHSYYGDPYQLSKYEFCLAPNVAGWNTNCYQGTPDFITSSPTQPTHFRFLKSSSARDRGYDASVFDIAGNQRDVSPDIGAWEWIDTSVAPTGITLSNSSIDENEAIGTLVGRFTTEDENSGDVHVYSIVGGDISYFSISGDSLLSNRVFNYETDSIASITIRTTDPEGLFFDSTITIKISNINEAVTGISLSKNVIAENSNAGSLVGVLSSSGVDLHDSYTYSLFSGNTNHFTIRSDSLFTNFKFDYETDSLDTITIRSTDNGGSFFNSQFVIRVTNINEYLSNFFLSKDSIAENVLSGTVIGTFTTDDPDEEDAYTFSLPNTLNFPDNALFDINGNNLVTKSSLDYENKNSYSIWVRVSNGTSTNYDTFDIRIINQNDTPDSIRLSKTSIGDTLPVGSLVGILSAKDQDTDDIIRFSVSRSVDSSLFSIRGDSLFTASVLSYRNKISYFVTVKAYDNHNSATTDTFTITIQSKPHIITQPANVFVGEGDTAYLSLQAIGTGNLSYDWYKHPSTSIVFKTSEVCTVSSSGLDKKTLFYCTVSNSYGETQTRTCTLTVLKNPVITKNLPDTVKLAENQPCTLSISATGDSLSYLWIKNTDDTLKETSERLILSSVKDTDTGNYRCIVYNPAKKLESNILFLNVLIPPRFTSVPDTFSSLEGDTARLKLTVQGTVPMNFTWIKNSKDTVSKTDELIIPNVSFNENGSYYYCKATNIVKSDSTGLIYLKVNPKPPVIDSQPVPCSVTENENAAFRIKALGASPLKYSWKKPGADTTTLSDSSVLIIKDVKTNMNGYNYFCRVLNNGGAVFSDTVSLTVISLKPVIKTQPLSQITNVKKSTQFFLVATGGDTLKYAWYKVGSETVLSTNDTFTIDTVLMSSSGSYYCIVHNNSGNDTSDTVTLTVENELTAPVISLHPQSQSNFNGGSVTFNVTAQGYPSPRFQWIRDNKYLTGDTLNTLILKNLTLENNGDSIKCMVYNSVDTVFSNFAVLTILPPPVASFTASPLSGKAGVNVTFTNTSTGSFNSSIWNFGDGITSTEQSPVHIYAKIGLYDVGLIVNGAAGADTIQMKKLIYAYNEGDNPVRISARYISNSNVVITFSGLDLIEPQIFPPVYDSLGIWISKVSFPTDANTSTRTKLYSRKIFENKKTFTDTLTLPEEGINWYLMNALYLTNKKISAFNLANGTDVLLADTNPPVNVLTIKGSHLGGDSSLITIGKSVDIDITKVDSVVFCYSPDNQSLNYSGTSAKWFSVNELINVSFVDKKIHDDIFSVGTQHIWCGVRLKGKNGKLSEPITTSFITENVTVPNVIKLQAQAVNSSTINLSWNKIETDGISKIRIWYGTNQIPLGNITFRSGFNSIEVAPNEINYSIELLNDLTTYYFGAQVKKDGTWSYITTDSRASATTRAPSNEPAVANKITFHTPLFDSINAKIKLSWCVDTIGIGDSLQLGITYSTDGFIIDHPQDIQVLRVQNLCDTATLKLNNILFNSTYYVSLWLRKYGGTWSKPVESSMKSIIIPGFHREPVTLFEPSILFDTVTAFNGTVILSKDSHYGKQDSTSNTIIFYPGNAFDGMVSVGNGFRFEKSFPTPEFWIAMRYSVPAGFKKSDIGMYRESPAGVMVQYGFVNDTVNNIISVKTNKIDYPFILLVDTIAPKVIFSAIAESIAQSGKMSNDTVDFSDNIINAGYNFCYSTGKDAVSIRVADTLIGKSKRLFLTIPKEFVSVETGIRAELRVFDGVHKTTYNMSKQVQIDKLEMMVLPMQWTPVSVSAELFYLNSDSLLGHISETDSNTYDNRYARVFYWYPTTVNKNSDNHWIEYDGTNKSLFNFTPGKTFWVKTRNEKKIDFGPALTMSLKDTATIILPPKEFTDFTLPYNFAIRINDIINATGSDSLGIYKWENDSGTFITSSVFIPGKANNQNRNDSLDWRFRNAFYTIYNLSNKEIKLNIPPTPVSMSTPAALNKKSQKQTWGVTVNTKLGKRSLSDIYCGFSEGVNKLRYPVTPGFSQTRVKIFERKENKCYSECITGNITDNAITQEIVFENKEAKASKFYYDLSVEGTLPNNLTYSILDPVSKDWKKSGAVDVAANNVEYRWLAVADHSFMNNFKNILSWKYSLAKVYAIRNAAILKFTIPTGAKERLKFSIFDALGRMVWEKTITGSLNCGEHMLVWNGVNSNGGKVGTGMYFVKFSVLDANGKISKVFNSRLMFVH